ncbi:MAG: hypothetical protein QOD84_1482, partial [Acidobacteriaceae bacterium]
QPVHGGFSRSDTALATDSTGNESRPPKSNSGSSEPDEFEGVDTEDGVLRKDVLNLHEKGGDVELTAVMRRKIYPLFSASNCH